jgi:hypothetical protein
MNYGPLKPPSAQALEVFAKVLENNPDADMRAIPNEWLLKERGISAEFSERLSALESNLRAALDELREMYHYDGCTAQEIEDQLVRFSAPLTGGTER